MEFAGFDDDLFEEKPARTSVTENYQARMCEAGWFMHAKPDELVSQEDRLGAQKFAAEYLFLNKSYSAAVAKYEDILNNLPESTTTIKRECQENLVRCHIKVGTPDIAIVHAQSLHSTSKTADQLCVSYSVLLDVYLAAMKYKDALIAAQNIVSLHSDNSYLWMKLGLVYASLKKIPLINVKQLLHAHLPASVANTCVELNSEPPQLEKDPINCYHDFKSSEVCQAHGKGEEASTKRDVLIVAACLQRAYYNLVKTEGTSVGFAVSHTKMFKEKLLEDLNSLVDDCLLKELRKNVHQNDRIDVNSKTSEPILYCKENVKEKSDEDQEAWISEENFEKKWFGWIS